jgi:hypothetical protein
VKKIFKRRHSKVREWWDDADTWMDAADILAAVGPLALIVLTVALVVSAL